MSSYLSASSTAKDAPSLAIDARSVAALKLGASKGEVATVRKAAQQFEALLLEQMMKSMRDTVEDSELWDSGSTKMFQGMYDQQMASEMSTSRGIGLADMLVRQLLPDTQMGAASRAANDLQMTTYAGRTKSVLPALAIGNVAQGQGANTAQLSAESINADASTVRTSASADDFVTRISGGLQTASLMLGVAPKVIAAHAALESGWGKREIKDSNGKTSFNLFGIKANDGWTGKVVETLTTEYVNGSPVKSREKFRAYDSYEEAFADYASLLGKNERYRKALNKGSDATGFGLALQSGGYATDPTYAVKLAKVARQSRLQQL